MAARYDLKVDQGSDAKLRFVFKHQGNPLDFTGFTAVMQICFGTYMADAADTLTSENGRLVMEQKEGKIQILFPSQVTELYQPGTYFYDLEIESPDGEVTRLLEGEIQIVPEVTRLRINKKSH